MFRRRRKRTLPERAMEFLWPGMGWRRTGIYYAVRLKRLPGTPYSIACGFACGAAVSFTPFVGLHFVLGALVALILRGNILAAAIGTAVGNPWTFPFIWSAIYYFGTRLLGFDAGGQAPKSLEMSTIFNEPETVLLPMTAGGLPVAIVVWFLFFIPLRRVIANYQYHRRQRRLRRRMNPVARSVSAMAAEVSMPPSNQPDMPPVELPPNPHIDIPEPDEGDAMSRAANDKG
jgi:uncharacterized protein (DUF2062 family)